MKKYWPIMWLVPFVLVSSCSTYEIDVDDDVGGGLIERKDELSAPALFSLGAGDEIAINVWRNSDLDRSVRIDISGNIYLPLIGEIHASGLTVPQLREEVVLRLSKYLVDPRVDINVTTSRSQKVHVLGAIMSPGALILDQELLVWEAISRAGGFTTDANQNHVLLVKSENGVVKVTAFNLNIRKMLKEGEFDQTQCLKNGDIVYVPRKFIADVEGFLTRFHNIINPFVTLERSIVLGPEVINALRGETEETEIIISP